MTFRRPTRREVLATLAICVIGTPIGYAAGIAADKIHRQKTGRSLVRAVTRQPCTPCEKAAMELAATRAKGEAK